MKTKVWKRQSIALRDEQPIDFWRENRISDGTMLIITETSRLRIKAPPGSNNEKHFPIEEQVTYN